MGSTKRSVNRIWTSPNTSSESFGDLQQPNDPRFDDLSYDLGQLSLRKNLRRDDLTSSFS